MSAAPPSRLFTPLAPSFAGRHEEPTPPPPLLPIRKPFFAPLAAPSAIPPLQPLPLPSSHCFAPSPRPLLRTSFTGNCNRLIVSVFRSSSLKTDNCQLKTAVPSRLSVSSTALRPLTFDFQPVSPFPAILTSNPSNHQKTSPVTPLDAALTDTPSRKSFPCVSYAKQGVGVVASLQTLPSRNGTPSSSSPNLKLPATDYRPLLADLLFLHHRPKISFRITKEVRHA